MVTVVGDRFWHVTKILILSPRFENCREIFSPQHESSHLLLSLPERQSVSSKSSMHHPQHHRQHPTTMYKQQHVRQASQATTAPSIDDQTEQKDWLLDGLTYY